MPRTSSQSETRVPSQWASEHYSDKGCLRSSPVKPSGSQMTLLFQVAPNRGAKRRFSFIEALDFVSRRQPVHLFPALLKTDRWVDPLPPFLAPCRIEKRRGVGRPDFSDRASARLDFLSRPPYFPVQNH